MRETGVDLVLETRGEEHAAEIVAALEAAGYEIERFDGSGRTEARAVIARRQGARGAALAELLRRPRFEILPLDGIEEQVLAHLATDVKVTVTASPRKGLEATLDLSERLARAGYTVVPHLSARLVRDRAHLEEVVARLLAAGVRELFVPAGDAPEPGEFPGAVDLLDARWARCARASTRSASPAIPRRIT